MDGEGFKYGAITLGVLFVSAVFYAGLFVFFPALPEGVATVLTGVVFFTLLIAIGKMVDKK